MVYFGVARRSLLVWSGVRGRGCQSTLVFYCVSVVFMHVYICIVDLIYHFPITVSTSRLVAFRRIIVAFLKILWVAFSFSIISPLLSWVLLLIGYLAFHLPIYVVESHSVVVEGM